MFQTLFLFSATKVQTDACLRIDIEKKVRTQLTGLPALLSTVTSMSWCCNKALTIFFFSLEVAFSFPRPRTVREAYGTGYTLFKWPSPPRHQNHLQLRGAEQFLPCCLPC